MRRLNRSTHGRPAAPVRIVHLGLGNFTRAHQAWYTEHAPDAHRWGIAAFTGRHPTAAEQLAPQDGLYTLITRNPEADRFEVISSLSKVHAAQDLRALIDYFASPDLAIVTSTITEAGYYRTSEGSLDLNAYPIGGDIETLRNVMVEGITPSTVSSSELSTVPARIVAGLLVRRRIGDLPLTILPCDNISENGSAFHRVMADFARHIDPTLIEWMDRNISWASSMVDRITPATTPAEIKAVIPLGYEDASPVPTEPFSEWVISGSFPAGRPAWEVAGARFVDDLLPYENRKLWMLNGSHSLMAYAGSILGCETVANAITHPRISSWVEAWWSEAALFLPIDSADYIHALRSRFANPRIRHLLTQIAADGSQKLPVRIRPIITAFRKRGLMPRGALIAVAAWILHLQGLGAPINDVAAEELGKFVTDSRHDTARALLAYLDPDFAQDLELVEGVLAAAEEILPAKG